MVKIIDVQTKTEKPEETESAPAGIVPFDTLKNRYAGMKTRTKTESNGSIFGLTWGPVKDWEQYDGPISKMINKVDDDLATAQMGQSVELVLHSSNLLTNSPWLYLVVSSAIYGSLKVKKLIPAMNAVRKAGPDVKPV